MTAYTLPVLLTFRMLWARFIAAFYRTAVWRNPWMSVRLPSLNLLPASISAIYKHRSNYGAYEDRHL